GDQDEVEGGERSRGARERAPEPKQGRRREEGPQHPSRRPVEQERRHGKSEQEVLDHVRAEEIVVREVVQRAGERAQEKDEAAEERDDLGGRHAPPVAAAALERRQVEPGERGESDNDGGIRMPRGTVGALGSQGWGARETPS